ncbi:MAG: hypothetical protein AB8H86_00755 [Polyangiales bacterium]
MRLRRTRVEGALSLIEGSLAVGLIGTFLAVFIPTFFREIHTSKVAEATDMMELIAERAGAYYNTSHETGRGSRRRCLPGPAGPTPPLPSEDPVAVEFTQPPTLPDPEVEVEDMEPGIGTETWLAIGLSTERELRFAYTFEPSRAGCGVMAREGEPLFVVRANGDLDGDGEHSTFEQGYRVRRGNVEAFGVLHVRRRVE